MKTNNFVTEEVYAVRISSKVLSKPVSTIKNNCGPMNKRQDVSS